MGGKERGKPPFSGRGAEVGREAPVLQKTEAKAAAVT